MLRWSGLYLPLCLPVPLWLVFQLHFPGRNNLDEQFDLFPESLHRMTLVIETVVSRTCCW